MSFKHIFTMVASIIVIAVIFIFGFTAGGGFATAAAEMTFKQHLVAADEGCFPAESWDALRLCLREQSPDGSWEWLDEAVVDEVAK